MSLFVLPEETPLSYLLRRVDLWNQCSLLLVSREHRDTIGEVFGDSRLVSVSSREELECHLDCVATERLSSVGVLCPSVTRWLEMDTELAKRFRRVCSHKLILAWQGNIDPVARNLRTCLHKAGFYEIAELDIEDPSEYLNSSVSALADGSFELQSKHPYSVCDIAPKVLMASRTALPLSAEQFWILQGNLRKDAFDNRLTSSDDSEIGLVTRTLDRKGPGHVSSLKIQAEVSWKYDGTEGSFAGIVGAYNGPGDSNMYVAMLDCYNTVFAQLALWRCDRQWERIAFTHFPLAPHPTTPSVYLQMTITPATVELSVDNHRLLWVYDEVITRTHQYGLRLRGNKFSVGNLTAVSS